MRPIYLLPTLLLLSGCANSLNELQKLNPPANDYNSALAAEYKAYAESEAEQGRRSNSEHFARKGLDALNGKEVLPEPADASLAKTDQDELAEARTALIKMQTEDMKRVAPQKLARAQLLFDCWQQQVTKRISQERAPCSEEFASDLSELQEVSDSFNYEREHAYVLSFLPGKARLDNEGNALLKEIAGHAKKADDYLIEVEIGKTADVSGHLAEKRLQLIKQRLARSGVSAGRVQLKEQDDTKKVCLGCEGGEPDGDTANIKIKLHHSEK